MLGFRSSLPKPKARGSCHKSNQENDENEGVNFARLSSASEAGLGMGPRKALAERNGRSPEVLLTPSKVPAGTDDKARAGCVRFPSRLSSQTLPESLRTSITSASSPWPPVKSKAATPASHAKVPSLRGTPGRLGQRSLGTPGSLLLKKRSPFCSSPAKESPLLPSAVDSGVVTPARTPRQLFNPCPDATPKALVSHAMPHQVNAGAGSETPRSPWVPPGLHIVTPHASQNVISGGIAVDEANTSHQGVRTANARRLKTPGFPTAAVGLPTIHQKQGRDTVKVVVRVRPLSSTELEHGTVKCLAQTSAESIKVLTVPEPQHFTYDAIAGESVDQEGVFQVAGRPLVETALSGYNSCIFAYGQTGSGKTFTMLGRNEEIGDEAPKPSREDRGLILRIFEHLFKKIAEEKARAQGTGKKEFIIKCSFLEIYNEAITDLLNPETESGLKIKDSPDLGVYVDGLKEETVSTVREMELLIAQGTACRRVGHTEMNRESSRSHSVLICTVESRTTDEHGLINTLRARLNMVDLAGSERQKASGAVGERLREASSINKSLYTLGRVINSLVEAQRSGGRCHIPYRDSSLTRLLQDCLGGNAKTIMVANISPASDSLQETLSTLRFAQGVKSIENKAIVNEDISGDVRLMRAEIHRLQQELIALRAGPVPHQVGLINRVPLTPLDGKASMCPATISGNGKTDEQGSVPVMQARTVLLGALQREETARRRVMHLEGELAAAQDLIRKSEVDQQRTKMMFRLKDSKIARLEALVHGCELPEGLGDETQHLREEVALLRAGVENHPEVKRFAVENLHLRGKVAELRTLANSDEVAAKLLDIDVLRQEMMGLLQEVDRLKSMPEVKVMEAAAARAAIQGADIIEKAMAQRQPSNDATPHQQLQAELQQRLKHADATIASQREELASQKAANAQLGQQLQQLEQDLDVFRRELKPENAEATSPMCPSCVPSVIRHIPNSSSLSGSEQEFQCSGDVDGEGAEPRRQQSPVGAQQVMPGLTAAPEDGSESMLRIENLEDRLRMETGLAAAANELMERLHIELEGQRVSVENLEEELKVQSSVASAALADGEQLRTEAGQLRVSIENLEEEVKVQHGLAAAAVAEREQLQTEAGRLRVSIENLEEEVKVQRGLAAAAVADREQLQTEAGRLRLGAQHLEAEKVKLQRQVAETKAALRAKERLMAEAERVALRHLASAHKENEKLRTDLEQRASKVMVLQRQVNALDTALQTSQAEAQMWKSKVEVLTLASSSLDDMHTASQPPNPFSHLGALELAPDVEAALREAATLAETLDLERSLGRHQRALIVEHEKEIQMVRQEADASKLALEAAERSLEDLQNEVATEMRLLAAKASEIDNLTAALHAAAEAVSSRDAELLRLRRERDVLAQQQADRSDQVGDVGLAVAFNAEQMPAVIEEADVAEKTAEVRAGLL